MILISLVCNCQIVYSAMDLRVFANGFSRCVCMLADSKVARIMPYAWLMSNVRHLDRSGAFAATLTLKARLVVEES